MKKLIPLMMGMALTFGAVTMYANAAPQKSTKTKSSTKMKSTKMKKSTKS